MANNWTSVSNTGEMLALANANSGGFFWTGMLFLIFVVLFTSMLFAGFEVAILGAAFSCLMIGLILAYMDLVGWIWVVMFAGIVIGMFLWIMYNRRD